MLWGNRTYHSGVYEKLACNGDDDQFRVRVAVGVFALNDVGVVVERMLTMW